MVGAKEDSSRAAKDLLQFSISDSRDPEEVAKEKELFQSTNDADIDRLYVVYLKVMRE